MKNLTKGLKMIERIPELNSASISEGEEYIAQDGDRDEWWIAPALPSVDAPREWRNDEALALKDAKALAIKYNCMYEVYKRVCIFVK